MESKSFASRPNLIEDLTLFDSLETLTNAQVAGLLREQALTNQLWAPLRDLYREAAERLEKLESVEIQENLRKEKDKRGWKRPWHEHYRIVQPESGPPRAENCAPHECEAPGCPRTESGFPE